MKTLFFLSICAALLIMNPRQNFAQISDDDKEFVTETYEDVLLQLKLGELAQVSGSVASVKDFGKTMTTEYSKTKEGLNALAKNKNITLSSELSEKGQRKYERLSKRVGHSFDKEYMDYMIEFQKDLAHEFDEASEDSKDSDVKTWAATTLPSMKSNIESARSLYKSIK